MDGPAACTPTTVTRSRRAGAAMRRNEPFATEYRLRRDDGTYATVHDQGYALEPGVVAGPFLGAALEVTAQRAAETLVRASEALLSAVAEGMGVALGVKDRAGRYLIANDAMSATLGVAPGAAVWTRRPRARSDRLGPARRAGPGRPHGRRRDSGSRTTSRARPS